jgi:hypothetical protein
MAKPKTFRGFRVGPARDIVEGERYRRQAVYGQVKHRDDLDPLDPLMTFVASTERIARDDWIVRVPGWRLDDYLRNPVFADGHNYSLLPLGVSRQVRKVLKGPDDGLPVPRLEMDVEWAAADENPKAPHVHACYVSGLMRAVSVGFIPIRFASLTEEQKAELGLNAWWGEEVLEADLLELSAVLVGSDAGALSVTQAVESGVSRGILTPGVLDFARTMERSAGVAARTAEAHGRAPARDTFWADVTRELARTLEVARMARKRGTRGGKGRRLRLVDGGSEFFADLRPASYFDQDTLDEQAWMGSDPEVRVVFGVVAVGEDVSNDATLVEGQKAVQSVHFDKSAGWEEAAASSWLAEQREALSSWRVEDGGTGDDAGKDGEGDDAGKDGEGEGAGDAAGEGTGDATAAGAGAGEGTGDALAAGVGDAHTRDVEAAAPQVLEVLRGISAAASETADLLESQMGDGEGEGEGTTPAPGEGGEGTGGGAGSPAAPSQAGAQASAVRLLAEALRNVSGRDLTALVRNAVKAELAPMLGELADEIHDLRAAIQGAARGGSGSGKGARRPRRSTPEGTGAGGGGMSTVAAALGNLRETVKGSK